MVVSVGRRWSDDAMQDTDPITAELFRNAIAALGDEMVLTIYRTAYSGVLKMAVAALDKTEDGNDEPLPNNTAAHGAAKALAH